MIRVSIAALACAAWLASSATPCTAADAIEVRSVHFAKGQSAAKAIASIQGRQTIDYRLRARAGQVMSVTLTARNNSLAFNVLPPGSNDAAIGDAIERRQWTGTLPLDGEYTIRTYLNRASARRGERADFTLSVSIDAARAAADAPMREGAAVRASQGRFDATGQVPCAEAFGQPMSPCAFGVARDGGGTAAIVVTRPSGARRMIMFDRGRVTGSDLSLADTKAVVKVHQQADLFMIEIGTERYEIPLAAATGG